MEDTKKNHGPESPADLEWSQGAKNPRKENNSDDDDDKIDMIKIGTLFSDTDDDDDDGTLLVLKDIPETSKGDISQKNVPVRDNAIGTPSGDTVVKSHTQNKKRRNDEPHSNLTAKKSKTKNAPPYTQSLKPEILKKRESEREERLQYQQKVKQSNNVHKKIYDDFLARIKSIDSLEKLSGYRSMDWLANCIKKKSQVYEELRQQPLCAVFCQHEKDGSVSRTQAKFIQEFIMDCLIEYYQPHRRDIVKFEDCHYEQGFFRVICADKFSLLFLKSLSLENVWPGSPKISVVTNYDIVDLLVVTVTLPRDRFKDFHHDFLKLIVFQNRDIDTRRWTLTKKDIQTDKEVWYLKMDRISVQDILAVGGKLYCGVEYVTFNSSEQFP